MPAPAQFTADPQFPTLEEHAQAQVTPQQRMPGQRVHPMRQLPMPRLRTPAFRMQLRVEAAAKNTDNWPLKRAEAICRISPQFPDGLGSVYAERTISTIRSRSSSFYVM
jgi:hypothetical protein